MSLGPVELFTMNGIHNLRCTIIVHYKWWIADVWMFGPQGTKTRTHNTIKMHQNIRKVDWNEMVEDSLPYKIRYPNNRCNDERECTAHFPASAYKKRNNRGVLAGDDQELF